MKGGEFFRLSFGLWHSFTTCKQRQFAPRATFQPANSYKRTRVADPGSGAFLTPGSGMGKNSRSGSGMNIPDHISESLETFFGVKNT
jgi:hypothetical protein